MTSKFFNPVYYPESPTSKRERSRFWPRPGSVRSDMKGRPSQELDPELGASDVTARGVAYQSVYPKEINSLDTEYDFMVPRRFGWLHMRVLLQQQDELRPLEQRLQQLDRDDDRHVSQNSAQNSPRIWLVKTIEDKLFEYSK